MYTTAGYCASYLMVASQMPVAAARSSYSARLTCRCRRSVGQWPGPVGGVLFNTSCRVAAFYRRAERTAGASRRNKRCVTKQQTLSMLPPLLLLLLLRRRRRRRRRAVDGVGRTRTPIRRNARTAVRCGDRKCACRYNWHSAPVSRAGHFRC